MNKSKTEKKPQDDKAPKTNRRSLTYILSIAVLALIAVALIGGPAIGGAVRRGTISFGEYAGEPIVRQPGNYFDRRIQDWARYFGQQGAEENAQTYYQIFQFAYSDTVLHMARLHAGREIGAGVSSEFVDTQIAQWPAFQVDGRFSAQEFQSMSSPELLILREYLRELAIAEQVRLDYLTAAELSDAEAEFIASMASPQRRFRYVEFGFDSFPEDEVVAYGEENATRFSQINISQITIDSSQGDAESIRQQAVDRTASFEDLARNQSSDEFGSDGGERGWVYNWDLEFDFEDAADLDELFSLEEGEISPVYEIGGRWRIYRVNEEPLEPDFTDEATVAEVRSYIGSFERGIVEDYLRVAADGFVAQAGEEGFAQAAAAINQLPQVTNYFPVNYGNASYFPPVQAQANATIENAGAFREEFLQSLFSLEPGEVSEPIVLRDFVFVFELGDERELSDDEIEEIRGSARDAIRSTLFNEGTQSVVDENLFVDNFVQTYSSAVLGQ